MATWGAYGSSVPIAGTRAPLLPAPKRKPAAGGGAFGSGGAFGATLPEQEYGGYTPDYASLISGDYEYLAGMSGFGAADVADEAQLNEILGSSQRAYDTGVTDLGRQLNRGVAQGDSDLAARGTLASGGLAVLRGALNEGYTRGVNQLGEQRANTERGARMSLAQNQAQRAMQAAMLRAQVANRLSQDPRYAPQAGEKARWNPVAGMYVGESGQMYDQGGNAFGSPVEMNWSAMNQQLAQIEAQRQAALRNAGGRGGTGMATPINRRLPVPTAPKGFWG
jgi:hypothetical protein